MAVVEYVLTEKAIEESKLLQDFTFWYLEIPPVKLYFNDDYFTARSFFTTRFQLFYWIIFRGSGGIYLCHLTGISVICRGPLYGIEFHYNIEDVLVNYCKLGRYKSSEYDKVICFPIDSSSGKIIYIIKVYLRYYIGEKIF